jgi:protein AFG1
MALQSPKGFMLHGEVGTGKSMLIDLFADCLPNRKKRRWHFNTFMLETISRLEQLRLSRSSSPLAGVAQDEYSLLWLARDLVEKSPILFLDEFQLPDRAAAKILSNLMTSFFQLGGVLIATSNRMPEELAKAAGMEFARPVSRLSRLGWRLGMQGSVGRDDGPGQKGEFAQFLEVLRTRCEVWEMESKQDYRRVAGMEGSSVHSTDAAKSNTTRSDAQGVSQQSAVTDTDEASTTSDSEVTVPKHYLLTPSLTATEAEMSSYRQSLTEIAHSATSAPASQRIPWTSFALRVYGRALIIPLQHNGVALFTFDQICGASLGPADFITLASTYPTILITSVPVLTLLQKNEARRFITLLDAMYEARCRLALTAAAAPDDIFFPTSASTPSQGTDQELIDDAVYPETYSEIHQDLVSPFRPNISSYTPSSALPMDSLEDDPPNRFRRPGSSYTDERRTGNTAAPDFSNIGGLTGEDERFAVKRAESRIWEMCSGSWWEKDHWRPLPKESRHWEMERPASEVQERGGAPREMFPYGASPFRASEDAPPKIWWTHAWGMVRWGKGAGAWGKGVDGLGERKREGEEEGKR